MSKLTKKIKISNIFEILHIVTKHFKHFVFIWKISTQIYKRTPILTNFLMHSIFAGLFSTLYKFELYTDKRKVAYWVAAYTDMGYLWFPMS